MYLTYSIAMELSHMAAEKVVLILNHQMIKVLPR